MDAAHPFVRPLAAFWGWTTLIALTFLPAVTLADDASQVTGPPPAIYNTTLAKLLTPAEEVLKKKPEQSELKGDGIVLLDEMVTYVTEDGRRISVSHFLDKAFNDAGVQSLAQNSFTYKKNLQRAYMVMAQTIQPDGTRDPVKSDAVFIKTPQDEADSSIYNDEVDLVTVYSNVKPGSIIEGITVLEDTEPTIPGQFSETYTWIGSWPEYLQRFVVDLPKSFADRLKVTNLGRGVPAPATINPDPSRQRITWERLNTPADLGDSSEPPADQAGPIVWLSTLESWDAFASWYNGLLEGTENISPDLKAEIDAWTKNARDPAEILGILYGHVARDVRYTGFELGKSDLQPHDSMSVWQRQYGDCKDKSNLLRSMLAYKGIASCLVFLDTAHAGVVNKANPDYRQFDHCIVDVQMGGKSIFCDPTITYGVPGLLDGSASDRDVLLLKDGRAEWAHTPSFQDAAITYAFDLQLRPNGEMAGWVEVTATGEYSAFYQSKYRDLTKDQILSDIQDLVRGFLPNSNVADVEPLKDLPPTGAAPPPFSMRAYMTLTGVLNQGDGSSELKFPVPDSLLPDISNYKSRHNATYIWPDFSRVTVRIRLPPGWKPATLPPPFIYDSPFADLHAAWSQDNQALAADFTATIKHDLIPADDWHTLGDAVSNLQSWASRSLILTKSTDAQLPSTAPQTDSQLAANLPVMPTGDGEINLIDAELPNNGNVAARRMALERVPALFPSDQKAIVEAAIDIAAIDLDAGKWSDVISRLQPIEEANRAVLDPDTIAWADYLIASALAGQGKKDQARALFQKIVEAGNTDAGRRGWAVFQVATFLADASPAAALDYADKGLDLDSTAAPSLYGLYASTAIGGNFQDRLKDRLTKLIAARPGNLENILLEVTNSARALIEVGHKQQGLDLLTLLESVSGPGTTGDSIARAIRKVRDGAESLTMYAKVQQDLKQALIQFPDIAALEKKQPPFSSAADAEKSASQHEDNNEPDEALGCSLRLLIGYPVDQNFSTYFWDCVKYAEWGTRNSSIPPKEPFFFKLAELGNELPRTSDAYADTKLLEAKVLERKDRRSDAATIYDALAKQTDLADGFQSPVALRSGKNSEEQGDYAKALASYQTAEKAVDTDEEAREAVLRAAFIQFDNGNTAEAFRLVNLLAQSANKVAAKPGEQVGDVIVLAQGATGLPSYWKNWPGWWPQWQQIEKAAGMEPVKDHKVIPIIPSLVDLGKDLGTAKNDKDNKGFFEIMREMAYAARFYPNAAQEFVDLFSLAEEVLPDHANDFRLLAISILEPLTPTGPTAARARILDLLVNYVDSDQSDKALATLARDSKPELDDDSIVTGAIHRVWGVAAVRQHQDLDKVRATLEHDLKAIPDTNRALTVGVLTDVYVALGRPQDAVTLIKTELDNPAIVADSSGQQDLKTRLDNIQNVSEGSQQLADGVATWLKDHQPPWWNYADPKTTDDPRFARLDDILKNPNGEFQPAEWVKAGLLAPSVVSLSRDTQEQAVLKAYSTLLDNIVSQDDANALAHSILDNPSFPASLKTSFLYNFLLDAYANNRKGTFEAFKSLPIYQAMPDDSKAVLDRLGSFLAVDRTSSPAVLGFVRGLTRNPMDSLSLGMTEDAVDNLLQSGDIDSANAIYQAAADYPLASNAGRSKPEFRLSLLKKINLARELKPAIDALRQAVLDTEKPETIAKPASFDQRRDLSTFGDVTDAEATTYRLYLIKIHQEPLSLDFWFGLMFDQKHNPAGYALNLKLLKAGLSSEADDRIKAQLVQFGWESLDIDNPSLRQTLLTLVQPYRDPVKFPQTMENIRMLDAFVALRTGRTVNLNTDLAGFTSELNTSRASQLKIRALLQAKNFPELKDTLNALSADQIMSPGVLNTALPALEAVQMKDEADLARDTLARQLHQDVLAVWFNLDATGLNSVRDDLDGLGAVQDIPEEFNHFIESHIARQEHVLGYQLTTAYLRKDWTAASAFGATYTRLYPEYYSSYWLLGRSLAELGKKDEAIRALTVYCQYSHDEVSYPDARDLLKKLGAPPK